ncbi:sulfite exporter TauE/SafE family protein [uncultured Bilophila sp.]|uniref:sulfite exporter TauE/SafE family protein n=1 Tax=uncultured Bilophila sp. TaxID=529385 RepID=UPI0025E6426F|nr:sulfite exporter TauE/SafE family protein [uncultured Bilophila sp.]
MLLSIAVYCSLGALAGILAGLLGVGGGIVIVPMLVFAFNWLHFPQETLMLLALGTSMTSIMFTSFSSTMAHNRLRNVEWKVLVRLLPGLIIGTSGGSFLASHIPARFLQIFFVVFLFFVVSQMVSGKKPKPSRHLPGAVGMTGAGGVIGLVSSLVGIGGGTLSVPFLLWHNVEMRKAIGTAAAIGFPNAVTGCIGYLINGWGAAHLPPYSLGYVYLPALLGIVAVSMIAAPLGARLAQRLPVPKLKRCFAVLLIAVGLKMLYSAVF